MARDPYSEIEKFCELLRSRNLGDAAGKIERSMLAGSTSTEILMRVRAEIDEIARSVDDAAVVQEARTLKKIINRSL